MKKRIRNKINKVIFRRRNNKILTLNKIVIKKKCKIIEEEDINNKKLKELNSI